MCMGGVVAYEMAQQLRAAGRRSGSGLARDLAARGGVDVPARLAPRASALAALVAARLTLDVESFQASSRP